MIKKAIVFILLSLFSGILYSSTTGKIAGVVKNKDTGETLAGANILVQGTYLGAASDVDGNFVILNVPVGQHSVKVSYMGFRDAINENVRVSVDLTTDLIFPMEPTTIQGEPVIITMQRPMIRRDETNTNVIRSGEEILNMPVRGLANVAATMAGVAKVDNSGTLNIRGGRGNENAVYIDGVLVNDPYNNLNRSYIPSEAIEELSVQTGGFTAEYGEAMSGMIIMTTNAGTSKYSGSIQGITDGFLSETDKGPLGAYSYGQNEYTATLGGPIIPGARHTFFLSGARTYMKNRLPSWGWSENLNKPEAFKGGIIPGLADAGWSFTGKVRFQLSRSMELKGSGVWTDDTYGSMNPIWLFNPSHAPETSTQHRSANLTFTHTLNPKTYYDLKFNYLQTYSELGDRAFGDDIMKYGDPTLVPDTTWSRNPANWGNAYTTRTSPNLDFFAPGAQYDNFAKNKTQMMGVDFDLTHQMGKFHTFKLGFEYKYHTMREFRYLSASQLSKKTDITELERYRLGDVRMYGYDIFGNEVNEGDYLTDVKRNDAGTPISGYQKQAPYHPIIMSAYIQDKVELNDLVLNLGLRYDRIDPNAWMFKELAVRTDASGNNIPGSGMFGGDRIFNKQDTKTSEPYAFISPRLGVSFPVTDRTMFHAQFGKFYQRPDLRDLYLSPFYLDAFVNRGGYFTTLFNPNLRPEKTTSYEVGFKQMLSDNASLQVTAFYKEVDDLIQVLNINTDVTNIAFNTNGDFGLIKGFDVIFSLRRSERVSANINYEYQTALTTGSATGSNFNIAWQGGARGNFPKFVQPNDFEQQHRGTVNVDYRMLEKDGPEVLGIYPLERLGVNMLFTAYSGHPFTRAYTFNTNPHDGRYDNDISTTPISAINGETTPWNYRFDLKLDRTFKLPAGLSMNWYLWVINVLNTRSVVDVWTTTGQPDQTGYLATSAGKNYYNALTSNEKQALSMREMDYFNYGVPRQIRLGCRLSF
jgi:outer membrane receptor protein involved in Fe transport